MKSCTTAVDPNPIPNLTRCVILPEPSPDSIGKSWSCKSIPGYKSLCPATDNSTFSENNNITLENLLKLPKDVPEWIPPGDLNQKFLELAHDILRPFPNITLDMLDELQQDPTSDCQEPFRFKIDKRKIWVTALPNQIDQSKRSFSHLRKLHPLKNLQKIVNELQETTYMEGIICMGDSAPMGPGFSLVWNIDWEPGQSSGIPTPLMEFGSPYDTWDIKLNETFHYREKYEWSTRKEMAVFRGGGRTCYPEQGDELAKTVNYSVPCGRWGLKNIADKCGGANVEVDADYIPLADQEQFKMIINAEGHFGWANRLGMLLAMENVVLRQFNAPFEEWYYAYLEPWVHYVPVDHLFNFLPSIVQWCVKNDHLLRKISKNADSYVKTFLPVKHQMQMFQVLVEEYAKRFVRNKNTGENESRQWITMEELETLTLTLLGGEYIKSKWEDSSKES